MGEFFKRKCGNIGALTESEGTCERPSFGLQIKSPTRSAKNIPLVDVTTMTEGMFFYEVRTLQFFTKFVFFEFIAIENNHLNFDCSLNH